MQLLIGVLGEFRAIVDGTEIAADAWRRERSAALVKLLAVSPGHRLHREQVFELFWPELDREAAGANLRKAVHFARKTLGAHELLELDEMVSLNAEVDCDLFSAAAKAALRDRRGFEDAAELYRGELLPDDRYAAWLEEPRRTLHDTYVRLLRAGKLWERLIAVEPTDEEAQCSLMQAALDAGNRGEVIRRFQELRERLRIDLGVGPSAKALAIYERALAAPSIETIDVVDRVRAALAWGLIHLHGGDFAKAEAVAIETRQLALGAGLAREVGEASALLAMVAHMQGRWPALFRTEFADWVRRAGDALSNVFDGHLCLAEFCLSSASGHAAMAREARELLAIAESAGSPAGRALAMMILGETELLSGKLDEAERLLGHAERVHGELGVTAGRVLAFERLAQIAFTRGDLSMTADIAARAHALARTTWLAPHLVIRAHALLVQAASSPDEVLERVRAGDRELSTKPCQVCSMSYRTASAIALVQAGETDDVDRRLDEAERIAGMWQGGPWQAALWEARGVLREARGHRDRALGAFSEAAAKFGDLGRPLDQARCADRATRVRV